ncbi:transglutaminase TgpA family protein [Cohnella terricola]|nr:transglutaminaseTgpA domain-containing protein [Cohnella terricola]
MMLKMAGRILRGVLTERLHRLLAIIVILQLIQIFGEYWWEETYSIIYGTLTVTAVTELLMTRLLWLRLTVQIVAIAGMILWKIPIVWYGGPEKWRDWGQVSEFVSLHASQFHPFFAITLGVVLAAHVIAWIGSRKFGAIAIIVLSIAAMAIADSFFPLELWHNIAWVVAAGLAWLVVLHLGQLRHRHPDSWEALAERPLDIAFPAILVITLVLLTGIFMPRAPVILEDPYTAWTEAQGREVPAFSGEGGFQSVSMPRSNGSSLSGYSRDDRKLGGGFQFDYSPVMTVTTSQRSYWRGESKSVYTGKGWADVKNPRLVSATIGKEAEPLELDPPRAKGVETIEVVQSVTVERKDRLPVLFAAGPAKAVTELKSDNNAGLKWNPHEWELRWDKTARVQKYSVVSEIAVLDEDVLRQIDTSKKSSIDVKPYLQIPDSVPKRVRDLAAEQTSGLSNDYDRAKKLEQFLKETFPYTNTPDLTKQKDRADGDFVDSFLFEIQEGYCDYFSTSFVVMARSIGLPTRWVKGYTAGYDLAAEERERYGGGFGRAPDPTGAGTYTVRNADAHSWAEVYFEGYGWVPFEPTSGFSIPQPRPASKPIQSDKELPVDTAPVEKPDLASKGTNWIVLAGAIGIALAIACGAIFGYRSKKIRQLWSRIRYGGNTPNERVVREMERLLSFLQRQGMRRESHETIRESFTRWGNKFSSLRGEFDGAVSSFERARYSKDKGNSQLLLEFNEAAEKIRKAL